MASTQDHIPIEDIKDDVVILKDGSMSLVLQTTAVNFGLLSENEQLAIISAFAALLNSLSFSIQIVVRSKRLDISSYLNLLAEFQKKQPNPLLSKLMANYRQFVETIVRENQVLDKQFYIIITVGSLELGLTKDVEGHFKKALTVLLPRRDHIIRQLWRTGLKASQLNTKQLINLFYDIYNPPKINIPKSDLEATSPKLETQVLYQEGIAKKPPVTKPIPIQQPPHQPSVVSATPNAILQKQAPAPQPPPTISNLTSPFVVEELTDEYGTI